MRELQPPQRRGAPRLRLRCLPLQLLAQTLLPLLDLGSGLSAEVFRLKHSANLDLGSPVERSALIASSIDLTCHSQKPAISSFVSVNGPSITVRFPSENLTRTPFELA